MSKAKFIGDPNDNFSGPDSFEWEGLEFSRTEWTEVPDEMALRLFKHNHYECERSLSSKSHIQVEPTYSHTVPEGIHGYSVSIQDIADSDPTKERLVSEASALGLQIDGRWGLARLQRTVEAARAAGN